MNTKDEPAAVGEDHGGQQNQAPVVYPRHPGGVKCGVCGGYGTRLRRTGFEPEDLIVPEPCAHCDGTGVRAQEDITPINNADASVFAGRTPR